jgi:RimJ/RimL family protein N-acetyltransferase
VIRTERLVLRRWRDEDLEPYAAMTADPVVMEHLGGTRSREDCRAFIATVEAHFDEHGWGLWAVEAPGVAPFIGYVGLWSATEVLGWPSVEVGWRLARAAWGHGYATEGSRESLRFGFEEVGLEEIVSFTVPQNERSIRVMERIGMARDPGGDFDHPRVDPAVHPELVRHVLYRLDRPTWSARTAPAAARVSRS